MSAGRLSRCTGRRRLTRPTTPRRSTPRVGQWRGDERPEAGVAGVQESLHQSRERFTPGSGPRSQSSHPWRHARALRLEHAEQSGPTKKSVNGSPGINHTIRTRVTAGSPVMPPATASSLADVVSRREPCREHNECQEAKDDDQVRPPLPIHAVIVSPATSRRQRSFLRKDGPRRAIATKKRMNSSTRTNHCLTSKLTARSSRRRSPGGRDENLDCGAHLPVVGVRPYGTRWGAFKMANESEALTPSATRRLHRGAHGQCSRH
jgi:hypothetical protein